MEHLDLLNKIIEAEQQASRISSAAKQKRDNLPFDLRRQQDELKAAYLSRAEKRIAIVQEQQDKETREKMEQLDLALNESTARLRTFFQDNHDKMVSELFLLVVSP